MSVWHARMHYIALLDFAGFERDETPTVSKILNRLHEQIEVRSDPLCTRAKALTKEENGRTIIVLNPTWNQIFKNIRKSHEVAEWWLKRLGFTDDPDIEFASDLLALTIRSPRQSVVAVSRTMYPTNFSDVAQALQISEFEAAFRVAEERCLPVAAIRSNDVFYGGPDFEWGPVHELKQLAKRLAEKTISHPLLRATRASDERSLMLVWAE